MREKLYPDPVSALADTSSNIRIMFGGFASAGSPSNQILARKRRGSTGITGIANNIGLGDKLADQIIFQARTGAVPRVAPDLHETQF
ncbi:MAG: hypothetical protein ACR2PL_18875 [Dehalococcoidia bacterium]